MKEIIAIDFIGEPGCPASLNSTLMQAPSPQLLAKKRQRLLPGVLALRGAEALGVVLPLECVARAIVAVEDVFGARALERRLVIVHVFGRGVLILIPEHPDNGARDLARQLDGGRVARAAYLLHPAAVEDRARGVARIRARAQPAHAPAPAVAHDTDAARVHALERRQGVEARLQVQCRLGVVELIALYLHVVFFRPPVVKKRNGHRVAVRPVAFRRLEREGIAIDPLMPRYVLAEHQPRKGPRAFGLIQVNLHLAALDLRRIDSVAHLFPSP